MNNTPTKPVPVVNPWAKPFWDAAAQERLSIQKCPDCGKYIFYPRLACPDCFCDTLDWVDCSGRGTVYTFTVVENNAPSAFVGDIPFVVAVVRLEEGVQMLTNVVDCDPGDVHCEMEVEVTFERLDQDFTLPKFKPAG